MWIIWVVGWFIYDLNIFVRSVVWNLSFWFGLSLRSVVCRSIRCLVIILVVVFFGKGLVRYLRMYDWRIGICWFDWFFFLIV